MAAHNIKYGNDFFATFEKPNTSIGFTITFWDLWIVIILNNKFEDKWDELVNYLYNNHSHYHKSNCESVAVHIKHLQKELEYNGLKPSELLVGLDSAVLKKETLKAQKKVINLNFQDKEKSEYMHQTPSKLGMEDALQGGWHKFPINPKKHAEALRKKVKKKSMYTKGQTSALYDKLFDYIEKHEKKSSLGELLALYRAFLSVILENMNNIDDSYGYIGDISLEVFNKYLELDWRQLPIDPEDYFQDIIKYVIWEDYGITYEIYPMMFNELTKLEGEIAASILKAEHNKLTKLFLRYQAENALTLLGTLYEKNKEFDKFLDIANEMGTRAWKRIVTLSKAAETNDKNDIALGVFKVSIEESENITGNKNLGGEHTEYLRKELTKLKTRLSKKKVH